MTYYRVIKPAEQDIKTGYATIENELLTEAEIKAKFPSISHNCFEKVEISKRNIYWSFGARYEKGNGYIEFMKKQYEIKLH